jgi:hypothetical protein
VADEQAGDEGRDGEGADRRQRHQPPRRSWCRAPSASPRGIPIHGRGSSPAALPPTRARSRSAAWPRPARLVATAAHSVAVAGLSRPRCCQIAIRAGASDQPQLLGAAYRLAPVIRR